VYEAPQGEVAFYQQLTTPDGFAYGRPGTAATKSAANITFRTSTTEHEAEFNRWYLESISLT
jgi:hypothetical protein